MCLEELLEQKELEVQILRGIKDDENFYQSVFIKYSDNKFIVCRKNKFKEIFRTDDILLVDRVARAIDLMVVDVIEPLHAV